ncbi:hypothetical protein K469DRAFT_162664 [Zopfia rhizophila CBS 207.26]|uniref:Secreted protein n=1 Tax=Zopfia rhizophila CBS 207.26 TaxID=1314779 RepID=A0A6A6E4U1_9PEZI|nr:hypothetical protein K469DRAFT_162664 [Zopfia rhizophila CBS 207.26]
MFAFVFFFFPLFSTCYGRLVHDTNAEFLCFSCCLDTTLRFPFCFCTGFGSGIGAFTWAGASGQYPFSVTHILLDGVGSKGVYQPQHIRSLAGFAFSWFMREEGSTEEGTSKNQRKLVFSSGWLSR